MHLGSFAAACFACGTAAAADMTAYGFEFNKPLPLVECRQSRPLPGDKWASYEAVTQTCLQGLYGSLQRNPPSGLIVFPPGRGVDDAASNSGNLSFRTENGTLQMLGVGTAGASVQDRILRDLISKYGQPTSSGTVTMSNAYGAKVDGVIATWKTDDLEVHFHGVVRRFDFGELLIGTPQGIAAFLAQREAATRPQGPKL